MFHDMQTSNDLNNLFKEARDGESFGKFNRFFEKNMLYQNHLRTL